METRNLRKDWHSRRTARNLKAFDLVSSGFGRGSVMLSFSGPQMETLRLSFSLREARQIIEMLAREIRRSEVFSPEQDPLPDGSIAENGGPSLSDVL